MKATRRTIGFVIAFVALVSTVACLNPPANTENTLVAIDNIVDNPKIYEGQKVTLKGEYRGWESGNGSPPVTRSDWVLKDNSGVIYITGGKPDNFDPVKDIGKQVTVTGTVKTKDGKAYIEASQVK